MGFLDRLLGGGKSEQAQQSPAETPECIHGVLVPHWEGAEDIGKYDRVAWYKCESCYATFSREDGERLQAEAADRLAAEDERISAR